MLFLFHRRPSGRATADLDTLESRFAPVHDEDAEALGHPFLDILGVRRNTTGYVELDAGGQDFLDRSLVSDRVGYALAVFIAA